MTQLVLVQGADLKKMIKEVFKEVETEKKQSQPGKIYTINQVAKKIGKSHYTVKKLVQGGLIATTKNGLITESALNDYLRPNQ